MGTFFLLAAVVGSTILVCQFVLSLLGSGDHMGADVAHDLSAGFHGGIHPGGDFHGDHPGDTHAESEEHTGSGHLFAVISFRTVVAAAAFFGASGKAALSAGYAPSTAFVLATIVGLFAMYGMYWLMRLMGSFDSYGNERIANALGRQATVYIPIPATRT
ncbi:MAG TPA: hypothetical protein VHE81_18025, partial [Lacipirellulaceae bacterium]|nr:hypothetical protein [Lacipirellulaceae bacterium]